MLLTDLRYIIFNVSSKCSLLPSRKIERVYSCSVLLKLHVFNLSLSGLSVGLCGVDAACRVHHK